MSARRLRRVAVLCVALAIAVAAPFGSAQDTTECFDADSGRCDLTVSATATLPSSDQVQVDVSVSNIGGTDSFETALTVTARGDWPPFSATVDPLPPQERQDFSAVFDIPESARGSQAVFVVEVAPVPGERGPGPNSTRTVIAVPESGEEPPPDVLPDGVTARVIDDGARVVLSGQVRNLGGATTAPITVTASAPGWTDGQQTLEDGLEGEGSLPFAIVLDTPAEQRGTSVRFHVAVAPLEAEEQTDNNATDTDPVEIPAAGDGTVRDPPDLAVARANARVIEAGQRVAVRGSIANRGGATNDELTLTVAAPGWDTESRSLSTGLAKGGTRVFRIVLAVPDSARGDDVSFHVLVEPVTDEENVANNARNTPAIVLPIVEAEDDDLGLWPLVLGGLALVGLAALALRRLARPGRGPGGRGREHPDDPREAGVGAEPAGPMEGAIDVPASPTRPERVVSTGFASEWGPAFPIAPDTSLTTSTSYLFWLEIGPPVAGSIEAAPVDIPETVPVGATLTVAIFSLDDHLVVAPDADVGELRLEPDGSVAVTAPAATELGVPEGSTLDLRRLFFRVRTGETPGTGRLRCNIYFEGVLVQARLVTAELTATGDRVEGALRAIVDYTLAPSLDPARLAQLEPHRLSVLVNETTAGSHDFYFLGQDGFKNSASFDGQELQNLISRARGALRRAAWGDPDEWAAGKAYRYGELVDLERLQQDLIRFALSGYRFYDAIINRLAGGHEGVAPLATMMLEPGLVQIASKESPRHVIPAALIYDYPLDTTAAIGDYTLCSTFAEALLQGRPLAEIECFQGECPNRAAATTVCPSGFWGYRHCLGMPMSVAGTAPDLPAEIAYTDGPRLAVAVSTDPAFVLRAGHEETLRGLRAGLGWSYADTRSEALTLLKEGRAEVVYFYCHGGVADDIPYIQVGSLDERGITRDLLRREAIEWSSPRPLVFVNGCHTTALEPEKAIEFVSGLVENARASGVIGTEITVFEPLASAFAEECLRRFLDGESIGAAVRGARLALLARGNPLGLAYIPFVTASLRLRAARADTDPSLADTVVA